MRRGMQRRGQERKQTGGRRREVIRPQRDLSPRQEARSGPARCPGGQTHSKEPSVFVQMPLWQRSSSLHSSTSAGQSSKRTHLLLCVTSQATPLHRSFPAPLASRPLTPPSTYLRPRPPVQAPPPGGLRPHPSQSLPSYPDLAPPLPSPNSTPPCSAPGGSTSRVPIMHQDPSPKLRLSIPPSSPYTALSWYKPTL